MLVIKYYLAVAVVGISMMAILNILQGWKDPREDEQH